MKGLRQIVAYVLSGLLVTGLLLLIANIIHLLLFLGRPDELHSALSILAAIFRSPLVFAVSLTSAVFLFICADYLFSSAPSRLSWKGISRIIGILALLLVIPKLNLFPSYYPDFQLYEVLSDKYRYLNQSQPLLNRKTFDQVISEAEMTKLSVIKERSVRRIFPLTRWYLSSEDAQKLVADQEYAASLNYAYCMSQVDTDSFLYQSSDEFQLALDSLNTSALAEREDYRVLPILVRWSNYQRLGDYDKVNKQYIDLLKHIDRCKEDDFEQYMIYQSLLADQYLRNRDRNATARIHLQNLELYISNGLSRKVEEYLLVALNAVSGYILTGELDSAYSLLLSMRGLAKDHEEGPYYSMYLSTKAYLYAQILIGEDNDIKVKPGYKERKRAGLSRSNSQEENLTLLTKETYNQAVLLDKEFKGEDQLGYFSTLTGYANFLLSIGEFDDAIVHFEEACQLEELESAEPIYHRKARMYLQMAKSLADPASIDVNELEHLNSTTYNEIIYRLQFLSEYEKNIYADLAHEEMGFIHALMIKSDQFSPGDIYNNILSTKNLVLYSIRHQRAMIDRLKDEQFKANYQETLDRLNQEYETSPSIVVELKEADEVVRQAEGYQPFDPRSVSWHHIQHVLNTNEAVVEIFALPIISNSIKGTKYYAILLQHGQKSPELIELCQQDELETLLAQPGSTKSYVNRLYRDSLAVFQQLLLKPILKEVDAATHFYLSLDGILHNISYAALFQDLEHTFEIVGSSRSIIKENPNDIPGTAVLIGDLDFGTVDSVADDLILLNERRKFTSLPYTGVEVRQINSILSKSGFNTQMITGDEATEDRIKQIADLDPSILHIATHGFYDKDKYEIRNLNNRNTGDNDCRMCKSKLALSDVNVRSSGFSHNNGILTAMDVALMDFRQTDLVVLSACESGLGDVIYSEGIQGFQRAFAQAGVEYTLVSLWPVRDKHTAELMTLFYQFVAAGQSNPSALLNAQVTMKKKYKDPYYWAGFIIVRS